VNSVPSLQTPAKFLCVSFFLTNELFSEKHRLRSPLLETCSTLPLSPNSYALCSTFFLFQLLVSVLLTSSLPQLIIFSFPLFFSPPRFGCFPFNLSFFLFGQGVPAPFLLPPPPWPFERSPSHPLLHPFFARDDFFGFINVNLRYAHFPPPPHVASSPPPLPNLVCTTPMCQFPVTTVPSVFYGLPGTWSVSA